MGRTAKLLVCCFFGPWLSLAAGPAARNLGLPLPGQPGPFNAITDVAGVAVGHLTLIQGEGSEAVRTGVSAVLPRGLHDDEAVWAAIERFNGNGEVTGAHWVAESGRLEGPVMLTNTHAVGAVHEGVIRWSLEHQRTPASLPVVAETWDGLLNDINGFHVRPAHAQAALNSALAGQPVAEGNVGGGTGMRAFDFKAGIGSASRQVRVANVAVDFTVGVLVQANFGRRAQLTVAGIPVGLALAEPRPLIHHRPPGEGSCIVIIATDAPLLPHQLARLARRAPLGLARVGATSLNSSGDFAIAFSTARTDRTVAEPAVEHAHAIANAALDPLLGAVVEATEEAILNALLEAETMTGIHGNVLPALPAERLRDVLHTHQRLLPAATTSR